MNGKFYKFINHYKKDGITISTHYFDNGTSSISFDDGGEVVEISDPKASIDEIISALEDARLNLLNANHYK